MSNVELCRKALEDSSAPRAVRRQAACVLGALAAAPDAPTATEFIASLGDKQTKPKVMDQGLDTCLVQPFVRAIVHNDRCVY